MPVRLKGVRVERSRRFGDVYLALALWRGMGLADLCEQLLPAGKEAVPWAKMAAVLVAARLCEPSSELHIAEDWYRRTALSDLLQLDDELVNKDRLYRSARPVAAAQGRAGSASVKRCGELFAVDNEVLLYDVTSTYFEGEAPRNPQAQRGYWRDHRPDCKQVCIALVVTFDGFPLGYEVFAGNTHDSNTVQTIVDTMEARHGVLGRVWIADRGMASAKNLAWLRQTGRRYIIGAPKAELRGSPPSWPQPAAGARSATASRSSWRAARHRETAILCRSADRRSKEQAMHDRFSQRIEAALASLPGASSAQEAARCRPRSTARSAACCSATSAPPRALRSRCRPPTVRPACTCTSTAARLRRMGGALRRRLRAAHQHHRLERRAAVAGLHPAHPGRGRLPHPERSAADSPDLASARGSRAGPHPRLLPRLRAVEEPRDVAEPRWPGQLPAHLLEELARIQSHDVILPTATHGEIRLRCVAQPDDAQAALLDRLGIVLPKRMRPDDLDLPPALSA